MSQDEDYIKDKGHNVVHNITSVIELVLIAVLVAGIVIQLLKVPQMLGFCNGNFDLHHLISYVATMVITVEFIHVIISRDFGSIIEILLFAIVREMVIYERTMPELLIGVVCIAGLFAIRKYLTIRQG